MPNKNPDYIIGSIPLTATAEVVTAGGAMETGFRTGWINGEQKATGIAFDLTAGAGVGSPYAVLTIEMPDGTTRYSRLDIRTVLEPWLDALIAQEVTP